MILAGDIGGTKVNLALFNRLEKGYHSIRSASYHSAKYGGLDKIIAEFLAAGSEKPSQACFGIAGPVIDREVHTTNLPWIIRAADLEQKFDIPVVHLLNDLEANAHGIFTLEDSDFLVLQAGSLDATGNAAVIAAGTGLGEAGLFWDGKKHRPFACEGGHSDFSPRNDVDIALLVHLLKKYPAAGWEHLLSGQGLVRIHEFLREHTGIPAPAWLEQEAREEDPAAAISRAGLEGKDAVCVQAVDLFAKYYAAEAGNLALKIMATGGVYIGGGIAPKMLPALQRVDFSFHFCDKPPMEKLLRKIPIKVILNDKTALLGAAHYAALASD